MRKQRTGSRQSIQLCKLLRALFECVAISQRTGRNSLPAEECTGRGEMSTMSVMYYRSAVMWRGVTANGWKIREQPNTGIEMFFLYSAVLNQCDSNPCFYRGENCDGPGESIIKFIKLVTQLQMNSCPQGVFLGLFPILYSMSPQTGRLTNSVWWSLTGFFCRVGLQIVQGKVPSKKQFVTNNQLLELKMRWNLLACLWNSSGFILLLC